MKHQVVFCVQVDEQLMSETLCTSASQRNSLHPSINPWHRRRWGNSKWRSSSVSSRPTGMSTGKEDTQRPLTQQPRVHPRGVEARHNSGDPGNHFALNVLSCDFSPISLELYLFFVVEVKVVKRVEALVHPSLVPSHSAFDGDALGSRVQHKLLQVVKLNLRRWCSLLTGTHTHPKKRKLPK